MLTEILDELQRAADAGDYAHYDGAQLLEETIDSLNTLAVDLARGGQHQIAADLRHVISYEE